MTLQISMDFIGTMPPPYSLSPYTCRNDTPFSPVRLGLYLVSLSENSQEIPAPSNIADISTEDGQTTYISTDMNAYRRDTRAVKKMLSIPAWFAKEAEEHNISLSKVLQDTLKEQLHLA